MAETSIGHNTVDQLKDAIAKYVNCDEESAKLNDKRAEIRSKVKDLGLDTKAFQDAISRLKKDRSKKDGYDESLATINGVIDGMGGAKDDLFSWMDARQLAKEKAREESKKAREAEAKKNDEFKPATERKPKNEKTLGQTLAEAHPVVQ